MRKGLLFALAIWSAVGIARGQAPYPAYPYGPSYPPAGYAAPGWSPAPYGYNPAPYTQPLVAGPYNPYPVLNSTSKSCPTCEAKPVPVPAPLPAACEPMACPPAAPCPADCATTKPHKRLFGCCPSGEGDDCCDRCHCGFDRPPPSNAPCGYPCYGRVEALYMWMQPDTIPGGNKTGSTGSSVTVPGFNSISLNNFTTHYNDAVAISHFGGRATLGRWLDSDQYWGLEGTIFGASQTSRPNYVTSGPTTAPSATQITNVSSMLGVSPAQATALLNSLNGQNLVGTSTVLGGAEMNLRYQICRSAVGHIDMLFGFRYVDLAEAMGVMNTQDMVLVTTRNTFMGGQVGIEGELNCRCLFINGWGKAALGNNHQFANAGSSSTVGMPTGFFSLAGNEASADRNQLSGFGEAGLAVGCQLGTHCRIFGSYTIFALNNAVRPSGQINNFLTTPAGPLSFMDSTFWAQGVSVGLEFRY